MLVGKDGILELDNGIRAISDCFGRYKILGGCTIGDMSIFVIDDKITSSLLVNGKVPAGIIGFIGCSVALLAVGSWCDIECADVGVDMWTGSSISIFDGATIASLRDVDILLGCRMDDIFNVSLVTFGMCTVSLDGGILLFSISASI